MQTTPKMMWISVPAALLLAIGAGGCTHGDAYNQVVETPDSAVKPATTITCDNIRQPVRLQTDCPALPNTIAGGKIQSSSVGNILDYDLFSWNSFVALNWPAVIPGEGNGYTRGFPDQTKSFTEAQPDDLTVWETLKEKREIFLADPFTGHITPNPQPEAWNAAPVYGPVDQQVPLCSDTADNLPDLDRHIVFAVKGENFDSEDETAEVASEARETNAVLCVGHDPNCNVSGSAVGPRVWRGQPNDGGSPVLYEVKVNWDFYNYLQNFSGGPLWVQQNARTAAVNGKITLPARTSAQHAPWVPSGSHLPSPPPAGQSAYGFNPLVTSYDANACLGGPRQTPCPAGSVHLKAAWLPLSSAEAASGRYHLANAFYYKNSGAQKCKTPQTFGLIGLHIIQRIHTQAFNAQGEAQEPAGSRGGTFIFSTWEHVDNDEAGFTYANLGPTQLDGQPISNPQPFPNVNTGSDAIPLRRVYAPLSTTKASNTLVHNALGCGGEPEQSVWCNYELIGTQYQAATVPSPQPQLLTVIPDSPLPNIESPPGSGQPYYLANLVIESNLGLQQFQGVPPGFTPIAHFTGPKPPPGTGGRIRGQGGNAPEIIANTDFFHFKHDYNNLSWRTAPRVSNLVQQSKISSNKGNFSGNKRGAHNMGGCMGCHGVAQSGGYSFSFVLLDNQAGGSPDTQEEVVIPPLPLDAE